MTTPPHAIDAVIQIRPALPQDLETVLDILNRATEKLLAKGLKQWTKRWEAEPTLRAIEAGKQFLAFESGQVKAVFQLSGKSSNPVVEAAHPGDLYLSRLAVDPKWQNHGFGKRVMEQVLRYANDLGKTLYLDCWAGNYKLKTFYKECGMEQFGDFPEDDYFITVFKALPLQGVD